MAQIISIISIIAVIGVVCMILSGCASYRYQASVSQARDNAKDATSEIKRAPTVPEDCH